MDTCKKNYLYWGINWAKNDYWRKRDFDSERTWKEFLLATKKEDSPENKAYFDSGYHYFLLKNIVYQEKDLIFGFSINIPSWYYKF